MVYHLSLLRLILTFISKNSTMSLKMALLTGKSLCPVSCGINWTQVAQRIFLIHYQYIALKIKAENYNLKFLLYIYPNGRPILNLISLILTRSTIISYQVLSLGFLWFKWKECLTVFVYLYNHVEKFEVFWYKK
jgi:hypothetical protein